MPCNLSMSTVHTVANHATEAKQCCEACSASVATKRKYAATASEK